MTQSVETSSEPSLPSPKERRRLRESAELSHEDVAAAVGVRATTVRSWEMGRTDPRGRKREAYARFLATLTPETPTLPPPEAEPVAEAEAADRPAEAEPVAEADPASTSTGRPAEAGAEAEAVAERALSGGRPADAEAHEAQDRPAQAAVADAELAGDGAPVPRAALGGGRLLAGRPAVGAGTRPKPAVKRAAKPPLAMPRHEAKTPVKVGSAGLSTESAATAGGFTTAIDTPGSAGPGDTSPPTPPEAAATAVPTLPTEPATTDEPGGDEAAGPAAEASGTTEAAEAATTAGAAEGADIGEGAAPAADAGTGAAGDADGDADGGDAPDPEGADSPLRSAPEAAFDALYGRTAAALTRQTYLLTGRRSLAREAVERAFQQAWNHWPEVATDPDPVGWVRAAAYEYALSPWHQLRRAHRHPDKPPAEPADRILLDAMLALPTTHRRTVLLYDGVGLDLPDTAAETEATTPAAAHRLLRAHADLADRMPELADVPPEERSALLRERLAELRPAVPLEPRRGPAVRHCVERRARLWTRTAIGLTAVIAVATAYTASTAPTHYEPPQAPGASVSGVPPHSGPQRITDESRALHDKLLADPAAGPARLAPLSE